MSTAPLVEALTILAEGRPRPCIECGRAHEYLPDRRTRGFYTWADPKDGHSYRPESAETFATRVLAEHEEQAKP